MRRVQLEANLEAIQREARNLLHALRQQDASALRRFHSIDPLVGLSEPSLADTRYVVAREYGCSSWQKLRAQLQDRQRSINLKKTYGLP